MRFFSSCKRSQMLNQLQKEKLDVLVIGGGITGAGIVLDSVTRGLSTCVIEMQDFSSGTSSRSTKLIHGGLRYLKQLNIKIVAEVGKERTIVYENGPHVTRPEWMMLPFHKGGTFGPLSTNVGLLVYDFLAGVKKGERRKMLSPTEAIDKEPLIKRDELKGAGYYVEYKTDDSRLTIEVIKKAVEYGGFALNYLKVIDFIYDANKQVIGVVVNDQIDNNEFKLYAKKVINATGPWVERLMDKNEPSNKNKLHITKGAHLVFNRDDFPLQQAVYFDAPDGRMIFAIPRNNKTYVGTTDTSYGDDILNPTVSLEDQDYLLTAINYMFPDLRLESTQVNSSWAGLRPLIAEPNKSPSEISRKDEVFISKSGLISIAGGKLTGYRHMGEEVVNLVVKQLKEEEGIIYSRSQTRSLPISGGEVDGSSGFEQFKLTQLKVGISLGLEKETAETLIQTYGANSKIVFRLLKEYELEAKENNIDPVVFARLIYAIKHESAYKPTDFFMRRTGALFFDIDWVELHKDNVVDYMGKLLKWTAKEEIQYREELELEINAAKNLSY